MKEHTGLVTIGIVNWNTRDLLIDLLRQLEEDETEFEREIIVVDNASEDGSAEAVKNEFPDVQLIINRENLGFTRACNQIMDRMKGDFLLLLNTDVEVPRGELDKLVKFMLERPDVALCGPKLLYPDGSLQASVRRFHDLTTVLWELTGLDRCFPKSRIFGRYLMSYWDHSEAREVDFVSGAVYLMRKEAIDDVGIFDEDYFLYVQDADWSYRAKQKGWRVCYVPEVQVVHFEEQSIKKIGTLKKYYGHFERLLFFRKHYGLWKARFLFLLTYLLTRLKLFINQILETFTDKSGRQYGWLIYYRKNSLNVIRNSGGQMLPERTC